VRIAPSGAVAGADTGHGVFATTDFQRNDVITEYAGVVMHAGTYSDPSDCMYDAAVISRDANEQLVIRGFRYTKDLRHVAQIANDARDARNNAMRMSIANAPFRGINETHGFHIVRLFGVATRNIPEGDEIFMPYHHSYWAGLRNDS
jgi:hypothetical protein